MNLKPARERICEASTGELSFILFLCALFAVTALLPFPSHAQSTESQPQRAVAGPSKAQPQPQPDSRDESNLEGKWGIQVVAVRLTAAGSFVDFRFRVVDPEKSKPLMKKDTKAYLLDQTSSAKLSVPVTSLGAQRSRGDPIAGRNYFILFTNSSGVVRHGSKVTITIGDFKAEDLTVQ